jgi:hypothetical protein
VVESRELAQLPVDRIADLLALEPGVVSLDQGDLSVRGAGPGAMATYLDGVPVTPGRRGSSALFGGSYLGERGAGIGVGTNAFEQVLLYRGLGPAEFGNGRGGAVAVETEGTCTEPRGLTGGYATDALFGKGNGLGFNRLTLNGGHRAGKLTVGGAAVFEGLSSERLGLEQNGSPIFVAAGLDTTVTFDPGSGTISEGIARFKESPNLILQCRLRLYRERYHRVRAGSGQRLRCPAMLASSRTGCSTTRISTTPVSSGPTAAGAAPSPGAGSGA